MKRRLLAWAFAWLLSGAFYLLLIDITDLPELIVAAGAAVLAATGFELAREQHVVGEAIRWRWLLRLYKPVAKAPSDIALVCWAIVRQLLRRERAAGTFRAVPFRACSESPLDAGSRALAESFGSFAPNTIIVGVDTERELILGHQLVRTGGSEAIDMLELG